MTMRRNCSDWKNRRTDIELCLGRTRSGERADLYHPLHQELFILKTIKANFLSRSMTAAIAMLFFNTTGTAWSQSPAGHESKSATSTQVCSGVSAADCLGVALAAMGGRDRLEAIRTVHFVDTGHTLLIEQSYRQDPFVVAYQHDAVTMDLANARLKSDTVLSWPESDNDQFELKLTSVVGTDGGVYRQSGPDTPIGPGDLLDARQLMALGPLRILLSAAKAKDLHYLPPEIVRSTSHPVLAFTWNAVPVRVLINPLNGLPDAVETTQQFPDMWYFWGDVQQRIYFDNWKYMQGLTLPTQLVNERNGVVWSSSQILEFTLNPPVDEALFKHDQAVAALSSESHKWNKTLKTDKAIELADGIVLYPGAWNATVIRQNDGLVILEAPISEHYISQIIAEARRRFPDLPVKAVLSTSDSWPHIGGVRFAVAQNLPVYILDLNRQLLDKLVLAPHTIAPDSLSAASATIKPQFNAVTTRTVIGTGDNRVELFPLPGPSTERQYAVYFPARQLLYASDTLALNGDGSLYDPELMMEVNRIVMQEHLQVQKVYSMHSEPMPWSEVTRLLNKAAGA
jgi:hypothetical protein